MAVVVDSSALARFDSAWERRRCDRLLKSLPQSASWRPGARATVVWNLLTVRRDLCLLGHGGLQPENVGERHLNALVRLWREGGADGRLAQGGRVLVRQPLTRRAGAALWTAVGHWCSAVGKPRMRQRFALVWPQEDGGETVRPRRTAQPLIKTVGQDVYERLLEQWRAQPGRQLHYWLARVVRELDMSVGEAVRLRPLRDIAPACTDVVVEGDRAYKTRLVMLNTDAKRVLAAQLREYAAQAGLDRLCWPQGGRDGVRSLAEGELRFRRAVTWSASRLELAAQAAVRGSLGPMGALDARG